MAKQHGLKICCYRCFRTEIFPFANSTVVLKEIHNKFERFWRNWSDWGQERICFWHSDKEGTVHCENLCEKIESIHKLGAREHFR